jgi:hypothetical protein
VARTNCVHKWSTDENGVTRCSGVCEKVFTHNYRVRTNFVLCRIVKVEEVDGIAMPDQAIEGKEFHVVGKGRNVTDLEVGDKVLLGGPRGSEFYPVPGKKDLVVVLEENVVLVIKP